MTNTLNAKPLNSRANPGALVVTKTCTSREGVTVPAGAIVQPLHGGNTGRVVTFDGQRISFDA